jgi:hypothetical protein
MNPAVKAKIWSGERSATLPMIQYSACQPVSAATTSVSVCCGASAAPRAARLR